MLQKKIADLVKSFPKREQYRLTDQMIRSSRSIARNIAEGYGRYHYQENNSVGRSRGSLNELLNNLITAFEENYTDKDQLESYRKEIESCHRLLNGYIRYLKKAKKDSDAKEDEVVINLFPITNNQITNNNERSCNCCCCANADRKSE